MAYYLQHLSKEKLGSVTVALVARLSRSKETELASQSAKAGLTGDSLAEPRTLEFARMMYRRQRK